MDAGLEASRARSGPHHSAPLAGNPEPADSAAGLGTERRRPGWSTRLESPAATPGRPSPLAPPLNGLEEGSYSATASTAAAMACLCSAS